MSVSRILMMAVLSVLAVEALPQQGLEPVLSEEYDYPKYPTGLTGFTGINRQQVAYWELKGPVRNLMPGYKGAVVRVPEGDLVACSGTRFWRSTDEGQTWEEFETDVPRTKEARLICLRDGTLLLTGGIYRSTDGGHTWETCERELPPDVEAQHGHYHPSGYAHTILERSDGTLLLFDSDGTYNAAEGEKPGSKAWVFRSHDGGRTWPEFQEVSSWENPWPFFCEASILQLSDSHLLAAVRVGDKVVVAAPCPEGLPPNTEASEHMILRESFDAGVSWSEPWDFLHYSQVHVHLLKLADGRILCSYANYHAPFGAAAVLSEDNGKTWDTDHPILLGVSPTCYCGWPTSVQLPDGTMVTTWASSPGGFNSVRWQLPPPSEGYQEE